MMFFTGFSYLGMIGIGRAAGLSEEEVFKAAPIVSRC
jgi:hypothetical protein